MRFLSIIFLLFFISCKQQPAEIVSVWKPYDQSGELEANADHEKSRMQFKLIQSKHLDKSRLWNKIRKQLGNFSETDYIKLKPLILEKSILSIQDNISKGELTYAYLTKWYLYRILKFENSRDSALHAIIDINPNAIKLANQLDKDRKEGHHPIYGMPILLKDNINTLDIATTAGAHVLKDNFTKDAFIVKQLKAKGAIILGKANLSEWAYFFCSGCPLGYSAIGGQTLNPYGRKIFETGGSSAGSGVAAAANYAIATIGTETSGSILSPSSQNSIVGFKPTVGVLSRTGIVPISSTLDTPGPMTKNVMDNAILLSAMLGLDDSDSASVEAKQNQINWSSLKKGALKAKRIGAFKHLLASDSIYKATVAHLKDIGTDIVEVDQIEVDMEGFITLLNIDMKNDLPNYLNSHADKTIGVRTISDVINYNASDTTAFAPYGQQLFEGIVADSTTVLELEKIKMRLNNSGQRYFNELMEQHDLEGFVSINNYHAGYAAVAHYPCLTVPMGYKSSGEPISLTFITKSFGEQKLLEWAYDFESTSKIRKIPIIYN